MTTLFGVQVVPIIVTTYPEYSKQTLLCNKHNVSSWILVTTQIVRLLSSCLGLFLGTVVIFTAIKIVENYQSRGGGYSPISGIKACADPKSMVFETFWSEIGYGHKLFFFFFPATGASNW